MEYKLRGASPTLIYRLLQSCVSTSLHTFTLPSLEMAPIFVFRNQVSNKKFQDLSFRLKKKKNSVGNFMILHQGFTWQTLVLLKFLQPFGVFLFIQVARVRFSNFLSKGRTEEMLTYGFTCLHHYLGFKI